jgi:hypothetical protein
MDEFIAGGRLADGEPHALIAAPEGDRVGIASRSMTFAQVAAVLQQLHTIALEIIDGLPTGSSAGPANGLLEPIS